MHASTLGALVAAIATVATAQYTIVDTFDQANFFDEFGFFNGADPTAGFVEYVDAGTANSTALAGISNGAVYLGVDHTTMNPSGGRASTRVTSHNAYTHGLFIADIAHMPGGICGVWPAFWTFGPNWPASGEIDIIEGVNAQASNSITLHTASGCRVTTAGSVNRVVLSDPDCNAGNANIGCGASTASETNYGTGFNGIGGGVYAMEWTSEAISIHFFPRTSIPDDITSGNPAPSGWGTPTVTFTGCDIDTHFANHNIIFDTTFCGQWAGSVWSSGSCAAAANTCEEYVGNNPNDFVDAYWSINSVKVYSSETTPKRAVAFSS